jgi:hypothetical protein
MYTHTHTVRAASKLGATRACEKLHPALEGAEGEKGAPLSEMLVWTKGGYVLFVVT